MPNIRPGMTGNQFLPQQNVQQKQAVQPQKQVQQPATQSPTDKAQFQARPTGTEGAQRLTSEATKAHIHQLIQQTPVQVPENRPPLELLNRPAMSSALAETLAGHQPAETQSQQPPQQAAQQNTHAQQAGGSLAAASHQKILDKTEDTARRNTAQSGKRARKEEQEGEFSSLTDSEGGMDQGDSSRDQRSDSQKKKHLLKDDFEDDDFERPKKTLPHVKNVKRASTGIKRANPTLPRIKQKPAAPKGKPDSEWTL